MYDLIVHSNTRVTPDLIELMDNMEVIGGAGAVVDNKNFQTATRKGIFVKPGLLANEGKIFAQSDINIAGLSHGRFEDGKED